MEGRRLYIIVYSPEVLLSENSGRRGWSNKSWCCPAPISKGESHLLLTTCPCPTWRGSLLLSVLLKTSDHSCSYLEGEAALVQPPEDLLLLLLLPGGGGCSCPASWRPPTAPAPTWRGRRPLSSLLRTSYCSCSYLEGEAALVQPPEDLLLLLLLPGGGGGSCPASWGPPTAPAPTWRGRLLLPVLLKTSDCSCSYLEGEAALVRPPEDLRLLLLRWEWRPVLPPALLRLQAEKKMYPTKIYAKNVIFLLRTRDKI
jgi:hypothetical protein